MTDRKNKVESKGHIETTTQKWELWAGLKVEERTGDTRTESEQTGRDAAGLSFIAQSDKKMPYKQVFFYLSMKM